MQPGRRLFVVAFWFVVGYAHFLSLANIRTWGFVTPVSKKWENRLPSRLSGSFEQQEGSGTKSRVGRDITGIATLEGNWNSTTFGASGCWGQKPLLLRSAFLSSPEENSLLPSWDEVLDLACCASNDEDRDMADAMTCRLVQHVPGQLDSFVLDFGPYNDIGIINNLLHENNNERASTLVVNDLDRWIPDLSDWMDEKFAFLPRWRRDDAQISLAAEGGGIGPHVDNYDVFLIQTSGSREWEVGLEPISVETEYQTLVEESEVRILNLTQTPGKTIKLMLEPGDCLYLPPRYIHCGTAVSNNCVTLSVGCRAPSASELLSKLAENLAQSSIEAAVRRYTDKNLFDPKLEPATNLLSTDVNVGMKDLLAGLVQEILCDDDAWSSLVGEVITEPNRPDSNFPFSLRNIDPDWKVDLGQWGSGRAALQSILSGKGLLRRTEGVSFAWSYSSDTNIGRLHCHGKTFRIEDSSLPSSMICSTLEKIASGGVIMGDWLQATIIDDSGGLDHAVFDFLCDLVDEGMIYGCSKED